MARICWRKTDLFPHFSRWEPAPCHRLDVGTGGLLLIAKTKESCARICGQVKDPPVNDFDKSCESPRFAEMRSVSPTD